MFVHEYEPRASTDEDLLENQSKCAPLVANAVKLHLVDRFYLPRNSDPHHAEEPIALANAQSGSRKTTGRVSTS